MCSDGGHRHGRRVLGCGPKQYNILRADPYLTYSDLPVKHARINYETRQQAACSRFIHSLGLKFVKNRVDIIVGKGVVALQLGFLDVEIHDLKIDALGEKLITQRCLVYVAALKIVDKLCRSE